MELTVDPFSIHLNDGNVSFTLNVPSLVLKTGECCYVMGPNGSGKSVLLRGLSGELQPTVGRLRVTVDGREYDYRRHPFPVVRQNVADNLAYDLTVRENLLAKLSISSMLERLFPAYRLSAKVEASMSWHRALFEKLDRPCGQLSLGQKQALAFLSVSSANAPLLMLDEFLSSTDFATSQLLRELIRAYADKIPAAVLVVSHDILSSMRDADRIIVLKDGAFVADVRRNDSQWSEGAITQFLS